MKTYIVLLLVLAIGVAVGRFSSKETGRASAQSVCATANGDVNGDGARDIGDPVYLLSWLFSNGPEPEPICPPSPVVVGLPDTGQTTCSDLAGVVVDCATGACAGQDGAYDTGCPTAGRFVDNGNGTVTDNCTGLMWQKNTGNGLALVNWCDALAYCETLEMGTNPAGGQHDDWRRPNVRELQSIVDYGNSSPALDPVFSAGGASGARYWTSTSLNANPQQAWTVCLLDGIVDDGQKTQVAQIVRAVRGGP